MSTYAYSRLLRDYMAASIAGARWNVAAELGGSETGLLLAFAGEMSAYADDAAPTAGRYFTPDLDAELQTVEDGRPALGLAMCGALEEFASKGDNDLADAVHALAWELRTRLALRDSCAAEADTMVAEWPES